MSTLLSPISAVPRYATGKDQHLRTLGNDVAKVAELLGWNLLPWQRYVAEVASELRPDGRWLYPTIILTVPRQVGKTALLFSVAMQRTLRLQDHRSWYTAQTGADARRTFREEWAPRIDDKLKGADLRRGNGEEHIRWPQTRGLIRIFPPTAAALHGSQADMVILDEAWQFDPERGEALMQAAIPTQTTRVRRQLWLVSTAGTTESVWMRQWIERGRNAERGIAYFDWSMPDDADPDDEEVWKSTHPAIGQLVTMEDLRSFRNTLGRNGFARAYLNRWPELPSVLTPGVLELSVWRGLVDSESTMISAPCFSADADPVTHEAIIAAAGAGSHATMHLELVEAQKGTVWLPQRLTDLAFKHGGTIALDEGGPIGWVAEELERAGVPVIKIKPGAYARACAQLVDAAHARLISHLGDARMDAAVLAAERAAMGGGWRWDRKRSSGDIAPLIASTLAFAGALAAPEEESAIF